MLSNRRVDEVIKVPNSCAEDYSESEPPDPIPNSEVKPLCADGSVAFAM